jgi:hypothetical protein
MGQRQKRRISSSDPSTKWGNVTATKTLVPFATERGGRDVGEEVRYRINKIRLYLTTDDQGKEKPALLFFRHASIGTNSLNTIPPSSRLLLPVLPRPLAA